MKSLTLLAALAATALSPGCAVTQPQNTPVEYWRETDPVGGRSYCIYVPSTYRDDTPAPLIVTCHGTPPYDVAEHHIREWKMLGEDNGCIIVAPELIATDGLIGDGPIVGMIDDERFILSIISTLSYRFNIDRSNVMITGFSGGGFPTYWVGLRHPDIFSAVVARSSNFSEHNLDGWFTPEPARQMVMIYYGENDPGAIAGQSRAGIKYLQSKGYRVATYVIPGLGHERRPDVAMRFFIQHKRPVPRPTQGD